MKIIFNCLVAWLSGWGLGLLLGFYDFGGVIYYDLSGALRSGALFACAFAISSLWAQLYKPENNN